jgi:formylglycine-generating enzyme required for sulfatase activity
MCFKNDEKGLVFCKIFYLGVLNVLKHDNLRLSSVREWEQYCKSGTKPEDIQWKADSMYKKDWISWWDWLDTGKNSRPIQSIQAFLEIKAICSYT